METTRIYISANTAAVDAAMVTKDNAVRGLQNTTKIPLEQLAVIGDEVIDIPMLSIEGIGLAGAPGKCAGQSKGSSKSKKRLSCAKQSA